MATYNVLRDLSRFSWNLFLTSLYTRGNNGNTVAMFESLKHWLDSLDNQSSLFDNSDDESLHLALASVLYHVIQVDHRESQREASEFRKVLRGEFSLSDEQINYLHTAVESATSNFEEDLRTINEHLNDNPMVKMFFMQKLIKLISIDGVLDDELDDFYRILHVTFPEIETR